MKRIFTAMAAAIGFATGAWATTVNLSALSGDKTLADGDVLTGTLSGYGYKVSIKDGATVTLQNVNIATNNIADQEYKWAGITCEGDATIVLSGNNTVHGFVAVYPGIFVPSGKTLTIQGAGSLTAIGGLHAAGIGSGGIGSGGIGSLSDGNCGNIIINGGTVNATGGGAAAGIGCGFGKNCDSVIINGGKVTAVGGECIVTNKAVNYNNFSGVAVTSGYGTAAGAGIGSGLWSVCGSITINGGVVNATGATAAAGIGCGGYRLTSGWANELIKCGDITINGGMVYAKAGFSAAGIGSGRVSSSSGRHSCGDIIINGGVVLVDGGGSYGVGIGAGYSSTCGKIVFRSILGPYVSILDLVATTAVGAAPHATCGEIVKDGGLISGTSSLDDNRYIIMWDGDLQWIEGDVTLYGGTPGAGYRKLTGKPIGHWKLSIADGAEVTLSGVNINGIDNPDCKWAGITCEGNATINLEGENVVKGWYRDYPGIYVPKYSKLTIKGGGALTASSNGQAAGIGGGNGNSLKCGDISIQGGRITAIGGGWSAGIGGGYSSGTDACGNINIYSGISYVIATCGANCSNPIGPGAGGGEGGEVHVASGLEDTTSGKTRRIASDVINLAGSGTITVSDGQVLIGTRPTVYRPKISIEDGATVTLSGVTIEGEYNDSFDWAGLNCLGDATIILEGSNVVQGCRNYPGIYVPVGKTLTIKGNGQLYAHGGYGAGIGAGKGVACGNIVIESGSIMATGGDNAAGIGGAENGNCGSIEIGPGIAWVVAERGSVYAVSIGHGKNSDCGNIAIDDSLNAMIVGNTNTRKIFSSNLGYLAEDTVMPDGAVLTGTLVVAAKISIAAGATVTLRNMDSSGLYGSEFAGLTCEGDATIVLEGKNRVDGYGNYPGIHVPPGKTLTIKGEGELTVNGGEYAAGIGAGKEINCGNIVIEGGTVNAKGGTWFAGIGGGYKATCGDITIKDGVVCTVGGVQGPGIGSGDGGTCGNIVITGGLIEATGNSGAGIGRGGSGVCGNITISAAVTRLVATSGGSSSGYAINASKDSTVTMAGMVGPVKHNPYVYPSFTSGAYLKRTLDQLGVAVPTDGTAYSVKVYGLPAGLKLKYNAAVKDKKGKVTKKAKSEWWIEGVPTASLDYDTNPVYLAVTVSGKTTLVPVELRVYAQEVTELDKLQVGVKIAQPNWLEGVVSGWTVSGLPAGLKYSTKGLIGVTGTPTKAGLYTITAKKKKGAYYETKKFRVLVRPKAVDASLFGSLGGKIDLAGAQIFDWNLMDDVSSVGGKVVKVTGLPPGLTFAASTTYKDKKRTQVKQQGQTIVGTPTKVGKYVVTFTKNVKSGKKTVAKTAQIIWEIKAGIPPDMGFNTAGGEIVESSIALKHDGSVMVFTASENAKVTAAGLPKGISLVSLGGGKWGFKGYTVKAGTYLVTMKATMYGNTVTQRVALKVAGLPAWAKGSFPGYVANGAGDITGLAAMSVTSAGKVSGKFTDGGKTWTFSAASFTESDGTYFAVPVTAKYAYKVKEKVKGKVQTVTKYLTRSFLFLIESGMYGGEAYLMEQVTDGSLVLGQQNLWGSTYKKIGAKLFVTGKNKFKVYKSNVVVDGKSCAIVVKVTTAGKATATLTYDTGKKSKGKPVYYKPTCSTVVIPHTTPEYYSQSKQFSGEVDLYFAPSAGNNFPGWGGYEMVP